MDKNIDRDKLLCCDDSTLFAQCRCEFYKATGRGGQKRNKTSSAVRLTHLASSVAVTASDRRSQHENRVLALRKLRLQLAVELRADFIFDDSIDLAMSLKNPRYCRLVAYLLDCFYANDFDLKNSAVALHVSSSKLLKTIFRDPLLWQHVNSQREKRQLNRLKGVK